MHNPSFDCTLCICRLFEPYIVQLMGKILERFGTHLLLSDMQQMEWLVQSWPISPAKVVFSGLLRMLPCSCPAFQQDLVSSNGGL